MGNGMIDILDLDYLWYYYKIKFGILYEEA
jgi:hypothetical protein